MTSSKPNSAAAASDRFADLVRAGPWRSTASPSTSRVRPRRLREGRGTASTANPGRCSMRTQRCCGAVLLSRLSLPVHSGYAGRVPTPGDGVQNRARRVRPGRRPYRSRGPRRRGDCHAHADSSAAHTTAVPCWLAESQHTAGGSRLLCNAGSRISIGFHRHSGSPHPRTTRHPADQRGHETNAVDMAQRHQRTT